MAVATTIVSVFYRTRTRLPTHEMSGRRGSNDEHEVDMEGHCEWCRMRVPVNPDGTCFLHHPTSAIQAKSLSEAPAEVASTLAEDEFDDGTSDQSADTFAPQVTPEAIPAPDTAIAYPPAAPDAMPPESMPVTPVAQAPEVPPAQPYVSQPDPTGIGLEAAAPWTPMPGTSEPPVYAYRPQTGVDGAAEQAIAQFSAPDGVATAPPEAPFPPAPDSAPTTGGPGLFPDWADSTTIAIPQPAPPPENAVPPEQLPLEQTAILPDYQQQPAVPQYSAPPAEPQSYAPMPAPVAQPLEAPPTALAPEPQAPMPETYEPAGADAYVAVETSKERNVRQWILLGVLVVVAAVAAAMFLLGFI